MFGSAWLMLAQASDFLGYCFNYQSIINIIDNIKKFYNLAWNVYGTILAKAWDNVHSKPGLFIRIVEGCNVYVYIANLT